MNQKFYKLNASLITTLFVHNRFTNVLVKINHYRKLNRLVRLKWSGNLVVNPEMESLKKERA